MTTNTVPSFSAGRNGHVYSTGPQIWYESLVEQADGKFIALQPWSVSRLNHDGTLDTSFGAGGTVPTNTVEPQSKFATDYLTELAVLPDGKLLVAGKATTSNSISMANARFVIARLNPDGSFDPGFGDDGIVHTTILQAGTSAISSMLVMPDGRILAAGQSTALNADGTPGYSMKSTMTLASYLPDGTLDVSFGKNGVLIDASADAFKVAGMAIQADGKLLVAANTAAISGSFTLFRLNADGSRDLSFGSNGMAQVNFVDAYSSATVTEIKLQPDGKILLAGSSHSTSQNTFAVSVARFNADGTLDQGFGSAGKFILGPVPGEATNRLGDTIRAIGIGDDGDIALVANAEILRGPKLRLAVIRLDGDGTLDDSSGVQPVQLLDAGIDGYLYLKGALIERDGSIVVTAQTNSIKRETSVAEFIRLNPDGSINTSAGEQSAAASNKAAYVQGYPAHALNPDIGISDAELAAPGANYGGMTLTIARHGGAKAEDGFTGSGTVEFKDGQVLAGGLAIGTVAASAGTLRIDFNGKASETLVNTVLRSIAYDHVGPLTQAGTVQLDWTFSDGNTGLQGTGGALSAQFATQLMLAATDTPYWIDALLANTGTGQSALQFRQEQLLLLGPARSVALTFDAQGLGKLSDAEQAQVRKLYAEITAATGLHADAAGAPVTFHHRADVSPDDAATPLDGYGANVYLASLPGSVTGADILRDFGHVLGLKHAGGDLAASGLSVMPIGAAGQVIAAGLGTLDIAALQFLYGPNPAARSGNDTYVLDAGSSNFVWDGGGNDTISAAGLNQDVTLSLTQGDWSHIGAKADSIVAAGQVTINFGTVIENALGGNGNDRLTGTTAANTLSGAAGDDRLTGLGGGDQLDGGTGIDFAVYAGARSGYTVLPRSAGGYTVQALGGGAPDLLLNVERIQFADANIAIDTNGAQVYRLYQAAFGRQPDSAGLGFWINAMDHGLSLKAMAAAFMPSAEFIKLYGATPDVTAFITRLYDNVLHRAPDTEGLAWWKALLDKGTISYADAMTGFSESPENVAQLIGQTQGGVAFIPFAG